MTILAEQFNELRRSPDAPTITPFVRDQLQSPPSVLNLINPNRDVQDPKAFLELKEKQRKEIIEGAFAREEALKDPDVMHPLSLRVAFRITREIARHLGHITYEDLLVDMDEGVWNKPHVRRKLHGREITSHVCSPAIDAISKSEGLMIGGIPLLPPDPETGTRGHVEAWKDTMAAITNHLNIAEGAPDDPDYGGLGLYWLFTNGWPAAIDIVEYEGILLEEILDEITKRGQVEAIRVLRKRHGYRDTDIRGLIKAAKGVLRDQTIGDIESERALMVRKLEDFTRRARKSLDLRAELGSLKQVGIILGISRAEPEDDKTEFTKMVKRVANEAPIPKQQVLLPGETQ